MVLHVQRWIGLVMGMAAHLLGAAPATAARFDANVEPGSSVILCDARGGRFAVSGTAGPETVDRSYPQRRLVVPERLLKYGPETAAGIRLVTGSRTLKLRCGRYQLRIEADVINSNPLGNMGGEPAYLVVHVLDRNRGIYGASFAHCYDGLKSTHYFYGSCDDGYASLISASADPASGGTRLVVRTDYTDREGEERTIEKTSVLP